MPADDIVLLVLHLYSCIKGNYRRSDAALCAGHRWPWTICREDSALCPSQHAWLPGATLEKDVTGRANHTGSHSGINVIFSGCLFIQIMNLATIQSNAKWIFILSGTHDRGTFKLLLPRSQQVQSSESVNLTFIQRYFALYQIWCILYL